jgi:uncharacterized protein (TIGR00299 family) protein
MMPEQPSSIVLDPIGGISGDMFVAGMLDAFPEFADPVLGLMRKAGLPAGLSVALVRRKSGGIAAAGLDFCGNAKAPSGDYSEFRRRLERAELPQAIRQHALGILALLAEAEAAVHGIQIENVHFHEIADWDTQADIVGAAAIIDCIGRANWHCRPLPLGSGTIECAHGRLPVPAPATAHLLQGFAFRADDGAPGERVTPTGAAILRYLNASRIDTPAGTLVASGYGAGSRQLKGIPNVLRVLGMSAVAQPDTPILVIEFDIDDQSPEEMAIALDRLRAVAGVRDVATFHGLGKKGRWLQSVRILADPSQREAVAAAIFSETSTLGLRLREDERLTLSRREVIVDEEAGPVRVKVADRPGRKTAKAEADDVALRGRGARGREAVRRSAARRALEREEKS